MDSFLCPPFFLVYRQVSHLFMYFWGLNENKGCWQWKNRKGNINLILFGYFKSKDTSNISVLLEPWITCDIRFKSQMTKIRKDGWLRRRFHISISYLQNCDICVSLNISVPGWYLVFCLDTPSFDSGKFQPI